MTRETFIKSLAAIGVTISLDLDMIEYYVPKYDDDADRYIKEIERMGITMDKAGRDAVYCCVYNYKKAGIWQKLDALYTFWPSNSNVVMINWINPKLP